MRVRHLGHIAGKFLAERQRRGVLQVGAAYLHDVGKRFHLLCEGLLQFLKRGEQGLLDGARGGDVHRRGKAVVGRLAGVDVVVRVNRLLAADLAAQQLDGAVGDHFVEVHVGLRARAGLPDRKRELGRPLAGDDFLGGLLDGFGNLGLQHAQVAVGTGRAELEHGERLDQGRGHLLAADAEILARALGLGAPEMIGRYGHIPEAVFFDAGG
ncbi:hypothetical protein D3C87_1401150 [compost metagenome]